MFALSREAAVVTVLGSLLVGPGAIPVKLHGTRPAGPAGYADLHNTSSRELDLSGWTVQSCAGRQITDLAVLPDSTRLEPGAHYVIAGLDFGGTADLYVGEVAGDGYRLLAADGSVVDRVAVSPQSPCREAEHAPDCGGWALSRDATSTDTDNNRRDFACALPLG
ncbi:lamin tail domain-containing protein [Actinokineospora auranticolor]|nr:lamin tail domain-containing protein [Actinokineospora auranticolor]